MPTDARLRARSPTHSLILADGPYGAAAARTGFTRRVDAPRAARRGERDHLVTASKVACKALRGLSTDTNRLFGVTAPAERSPCIGGACVLRNSFDGVFLQRVKCEERIGAQRADWCKEPTPDNIKDATLSLLMNLPNCTALDRPLFDVLQAQKSPGEAEELVPKMGLCFEGLVVTNNNLTLFHFICLNGSSCASNGKSAHNTPETLPLFSPCVEFPPFSHFSLLGPCYSHEGLERFVLL
eukprot:980177-Prorocentrum_minimum.AAC.1